MITKESAVSDLGPFSVPVFGAADPMGKAAAQHIELTKRAHDEVLNGAQEVLTRWCERRHESAEAFAVLGHQALQAKTPHDVLQVWLQWSKGAMERLLEDAKDQMIVGTSVARNLTNGSTALAMSWTPTSDAAAAERLNDDLKASKAASRH